MSNVTLCACELNSISSELQPHESKFIMYALWPKMKLVAFFLCLLFLACDAGRGPPTSNAHAARSSWRAVQAVLSEREPGKTGKPRRSGSRGGKHGTRDARRAGIEVASSVSECEVEVDSARTVFLEVYAGKRSQAARAAKEQGAASIRIVKLVGGAARPAPDLENGRAQSWALDLARARDRCLLSTFVRSLEHRLRTRGANRLDKVVVVTAPPCTQWSSLQHPNRKKVKRRIRKQRRTEARQQLQGVRSLHAVLKKHAARAKRR
jgi:hypothetical protein